MKIRGAYVRVGCLLLWLTATGVPGLANADAAGLSEEGDKVIATESSSAVEIAGPAAGSSYKRMISELFSVMEPKPQPASMEGQKGSPVQEPETLLLLGTGLIGLIYVGRRHWRG